MNCEMKIRTIRSMDGRLRNNHADNELHHTCWLAAEHRGWHGCECGAIWDDSTDGAVPLKPGSLNDQAKQAPINNATTCRFGLRLADDDFDKLGEELDRIAMQKHETAN